MNPMAMYTPQNLYDHIVAQRNHYLAEYHAARDKRTTPKQAYSWHVNTSGTFILVIRTRKPQYLYKSEYEQLVKDVESSDREVTRRDVDHKLQTREIEVRQDKNGS